MVRRATGGETAGGAGETDEDEDGARASRFVGGLANGAQVDGAHQHGLVREVKQRDHLTSRLDARKK